MPVVELSPAVTVVADLAAWGVIHTGTGYLVHRLPVGRLGPGRLYRGRAFERDGAAYGALRIKRWKDRLPEAGAFFAGGMSKRHLPPPAAGGLQRFVIETRRAELGHWLAAAGGPLFVLWNRPAVAAALVAYGVAVNLPFIAIQRYNRLRAERVLRVRRDRSRMAGADSSAARRSAGPGRNGSSIP